MHRPDGWRKTTLGELIRQTDYGVSVPLFDAGNIPVLRMMNLADGRIDLADLRYSDRREAQSLRLRAGDVLFNRTNSLVHVGRTSLWRCELPAASFASYCVRFVCRESEIEPAYLVWYMNLPEVQIFIKRIATPAVQQVNVNPTRLRALLDVWFPKSLDEQRNIVTVLEAADDAIRQTEAIIAKLRQMKAGLLHDLLTRGIDEQGRLRDPVTRPVEFAASRLGRIPTSWVVQPIGELFDIQLGKMLSQNAKKGKRPLPYLANRHVQWDVRPAFFLAFMHHASRIGAFTHFVSQTSIAHLTREKLALIPMTLPPLEEQHVINAVIQAHDSVIRVEETYRDKLKLQKRGLMHDLLSGRVRV